MKLAIHQPNFLPWSGFFVKASLVDVFLLYSSAQFVKSEYHNRTRLGDHWLTVPVMQGLQPINTIVLASPQVNLKKIARTLSQTYPKCKYAHRLNGVIGILWEFSKRDYVNLAELNISLIRAMAKELGLTTIWKEATEVDGSAIEKLRGMIATEKATAYVAGEGFLGYSKGESLGVPISIVKANASAYKGTALQLIATEESPLEAMQGMFS